ALDWITVAQASSLAISVALLGNAAEVHPELVSRNWIPDIVTDQTSAHDPLRGYYPAGFTKEQADILREKDPKAYLENSLDSIAKHVRAMLAMQEKGAIAFDYGNNIRGEAQANGVPNAFDIPGFVPEYIRPLFCEGKGPFRWVALSGDPEDIF